MRKLLFVLVLLIVLSGCSEKEKPIAADALHNIRLGCDISIGDKKDVIDDALGEPSESGAFHMYGDVTILYAEGEARLIVTTSPNWLTIGRIRVGNTVDSLLELYGDPGTTDAMIYMFDKNSNMVQNKVDAASFVSYAIKDELICSISLTISP
jgi:hypothetical protein